MEDKKLLMVGELAKKMGVTVRTLQYYDKEGLLEPSAISEGGRRLYSDQDVVKLHQILSFKSLGFSLSEIKEKLFSFEHPQDVIHMLEYQSKSIKSQIKELQKARSIIDSLKDEVAESGEVDFRKYSEVIEFLKVGNNGYWVWRNFDDTLKEHLRNRFTDHAQDGLRIYATYKELLEEAAALMRENASPEDEKSQIMAMKLWNMVMDFTGGDMSVIPKLDEFSQNKENWDPELARKQAEVESFQTEALNIYFSTTQQGEGKE